MTKGIGSIAQEFLPGSDQEPAEYISQFYGELRIIAGRLFRSERPNHTLQPTALVHESVIRLLEHGPEKFANRAHFFGVASRAMRQVLVEYARSRASQKRGGDWRRVPMEEADLIGLDPPNFLALDEALQRLEFFDSNLYQIAELRLFGTLTHEEIAIVLNKGESTIRRDWSVARAWLQRDLKKTSEQ